MERPFEIFQKMTDEGNNNLKLSPLSNIKRTRQGKDGWGEVTIAIPNECVSGFVIGNYVGGLIFVSKEEYEKYKN